VVPRAWLSHFNSFELAYLIGGTQVRRLASFRIGFSFLFGFGFVFVFGFCMRIFLCVFRFLFWHWVGSGFSCLVLDADSNFVVSVLVWFCFWFGIFLLLFYLLNALGRLGPG
jgi:hypothetical protein